MGNRNSALMQEAYRHSMSQLFRIGVFNMGSGAGAPREVPGGRRTFGSPVLGAGFWMPGSTSSGCMTPFDRFSSLLRFWLGAAGLAPGVVSFGAGLGAWANVARAIRAAAAIVQSRGSMIRMLS